VTSGMGAFVPSSPAHTINRRLGDCKDKSLLLSRLLNKLGVAAQPALINAANGRMPSQSLPSLNVFDHVVVRMEREGAEPLWIDATVSYERGALADRVNPNFGHALIVAEDSTELVEVPFDATQWGEVVTDDHFYLDEMPVELRSSAIYTGYEANRLRYLYSSGGKLHFTKMLEDHLKQTYPSIMGDGDIEIEDDEETNQVIVRRNYTLPDFSQESKERGNEIYSLQVDAIINRIIGAGESTREHPFAILFPCKVTQQFKIITGADLRKIRKDNIRFVTRDFEFKAELKSAKQGVAVSYFYQNRRNHVPVSGYSIYRKELLKAADFLVYSLELAKKRKHVRAPSDRAVDSPPVRPEFENESAQCEQTQVTLNELELPPMTPRLEKEIRTLEPEKSATYKRRRRTFEQGKNRSLKNPAKSLLKAMGILLLLVLVCVAGFALIRSKESKETEVTSFEEPIEIKNLIEPKEEYALIEKVGIPTPKTETREVADGLELLRQLIADGKNENAIVEAERILGRNPKSADVWEMLAGLYLSDGDMEGAFSASAEAEELAPENAKVLSTRGSVLYAMEQFEVALISFERATKMKSDFYRAWEGVGMCCLKLHRYEDAKVALLRAVEIDPNNPKAKNNLAVSLMQTGDVESAEDQLRMCLEIAPNYLNAWENLMEIYKRKNAPDKVAEIRIQIAQIRSANENTISQ
jgi:Tfp pilus assembly protein PilF